MRVSAAAGAVVGPRRRPAIRGAEGASYALDFRDAPSQEAALGLRAREREGAFVLAAVPRRSGRGGAAGRRGSSGSTGSRRGRAGRGGQGPRPGRPNSAIATARLSCDHRLIRCALGEGPRRAQRSDASHGVAAGAGRGDGCLDDVGVPALCRATARPRSSRPSSDLAARSTTTGLLVQRGTSTPSL